MTDKRAPETDGGAVEAVVERFLDHLEGHAEQPPSIEELDEEERRLAELLMASMRTARGMDPKAQPPPLEQLLAELPAEARAGLEQRQAEADEGLTALQRELRRVSELDVETVPRRPGVYCWWEEDRALFVTAAENLYEQVVERDMRPGQRPVPAFRQFVRTRLQARGELARGVKRAERVAAIDGFIAGCRISWSATDSFEQAQELADEATQQLLDGHTWQPRPGEDQWLRRYLDELERPGRVYVEVPVGAALGGKTRRIDAVRFPTLPDEVRYFDADSFVQALTGGVCELIEVKRSLNRTVIGQLLVARELLQAEFELASDLEVRLTALVAETDPALEPICDRFGIRVVHVDGVTDGPGGGARRLSTPTAATTDDIIFARIGDQLHPLESTPFKLEEDLQRLVAEHPELLAGAQMAPAAPRRFALVGTEVPVPDQAAGSGRWALDHLFVDQDAIPTLVEAKRAASSQLRREVVGQLLDYVSNATRYWRAGELAAAFDREHGDQAHEVLAELVGDDHDEDAFWDRVIDNLSEGRARLLFLADHIPTELQAIVEFLNERLDPTEVLAVELKQYRTPAGPQVLVPRIIGSTAAAKGTKRVAVPYDQLLAEASDTARQVEQLLLDWAERTDTTTTTGAKSRKFTSQDGVPLLFFYPRWETIEFTLGPIRNANPDLADQLDRALHQLSDRPMAGKHPNLPITRLVDQWEQFETQILEPYTTARRTYSGGRSRHPV